MVFLAADQVRAVDAFTATRSHFPDWRPPYGLVVEFVAFTGFRVGEITAFGIGNVDLRAGTVHMSRSASLVEGVLVEGSPGRGEDGRPSRPYRLADPRKPLTRAFPAKAPAGERRGWDLNPR
jgi:hypothetical protein